jgi:hypothetical protein
MSPEMRAEMLNPTNLGDYTEAQQREINKAIAAINSKNKDSNAV